MEYRRRGFEIDALTREITLRVRRTKCVPWGGTLPVDHEMLHARNALRPKVYVLHDTTKRNVRLIEKAATTNRPNTKSASTHFSTPYYSPTHHRFSHARAAFKTQNHSERTQKERERERVEIF